MQCNFHFKKYLLLVILFASTACWANNSNSIAPGLTGITLGGVTRSLNPAFDPNITRYSVIASVDDNAVSVTPAANVAVTIQVNGAVVPSGGSVNLQSLNPGESIRITAKQNSKQTTYEILYLPPDFPHLKVSSHREGVSEDPIYITALTKGTTITYLMNLDNNAVPTFYRKLDTFSVDYKLHESTQERSYSLRKTDLNRWGQRNGEIVILDSEGQDSEVIETVGLSHTDLHDFLITENNELVLLSYDGVYKDLSDLGIMSGDVLVEESVIQIIDRDTRKVNFEWRSLSGIPYSDQLFARYKSDYAHINSVVVDNDGNLLASLRGTSNIVKIDRTTGQLEWILGGKANQFTFINDPFTGPCGQHTATWLANGNLLVFDNGQQCLPEDNRGFVTRVVEYQLDEENLTAELVWSYKQENQYSVALGSAQRLDNGNTLIAWGRRRRSDDSILITEVNQQGEIVFEISTDNETPLFIYRAYRFAN